MPELRSPALILFAALAFVPVPAMRPADAATCQLTKVATLPVTVTPTNQVLIDGSIKGQPAKFQVDTGATDTTFDVSVFSRFGIANSGRQMRGVGATGEVSAIATDVPDLTIGNFRITSIYQVVLEKHFLPDGVYALFGEDFFTAYDLDIDFGNGALNLMQYNSCNTEPIYWSDKFSEADINVSRNKILVHVEINGTPAVAIFDTGASASVISWALARRLGLDKDSPGMTVLGTVRGVDMHPMTAYGFRFSEIGVGDEVVKNPFLQIIDLSPVKYDTSSLARIQDSNVQGYDALLGEDFIKAHHIYIATRQGKMYFTYNGKGAIFPAPPKPPSSAHAP